MKMIQLRHKTSIMSVALIVALAAVPLFTVGCNRAHSGDTRVATAMATSKAADPAFSTPLDISLQIDKSASVIPNGVDTVTMADVNEMALLLKLHGGNLGVGMITGHSDEPNVELHVSPPPVAPVAPSRNLNVFRRAILMPRFKAEQAAFRKRMDKWEMSTDQALRQFMAEVAPIVKHKANAQRTDIGGAIRRAELFLNSVQQREARHYLVLVTDLGDNRNIPFEPAPNISCLLVSNALANVGLLKGFDVVRFESMEEVIRFLSNQENKDGSL